MKRRTADEVLRLPAQEAPRHARAESEGETLEPVNSNEDNDSEVLHRLKCYGSPLRSSSRTIFPVTPERLKPDPIRLVDSPPWEPLTSVDEAQRRVLCEEVRIWLRFRSLMKGQLVERYFLEEGNRIYRRNKKLIAAINEELSATVSTSSSSSSSCASSRDAPLPSLYQSQSGPSLMKALRDSGGTTQTSTDPDDEDYKVRREDDPGFSEDYEEISLLAKNVTDNSSNPGNGTTNDSSAEFLRTSPSLLLAYYARDATSLLQRGSPPPSDIDPDEQRPQLCYEDSVAPSGRSLFRGGHADNESLVSLKTPLTLQSTRTPRGCYERVLAALSLEGAAEPAPLPDPPLSSIVVSRPSWVRRPGAAARKGAARPESQAGALPCETPCPPKARPCDEDEDARVVSQTEQLLRRRKPKSLVRSALSLPAPSPRFRPRRSVKAATTAVSLDEYVYLSALNSFPRPERPSKPNAREVTSATLGPATPPVQGSVKESFLRDKGAHIPPVYSLPPAAVPLPPVTPAPPPRDNPNRKGVAIHLFNALRSAQARSELELPPPPPLPPSSSSFSTQKEKE